MNWGYKILTVYIIFIAGILFLVFKASSQNQDLVATDYYEQELKFQDRIDETDRTNALSAPITLEVCDKELTIKFPPEMAGAEVSAELLLYCIADKAKDVKKKFTTTDAVIHLPLSAKDQGLYEVKINWQANGEGYYFQRKLMIK